MTKPTTLAAQKQSSALKPQRVKHAAFSITQSAINKLLDAKANAYQICVYLVLAQFTDSSGKYSTAGPNAMSKYLGANKSKGCPVDRALDSLQGKKIFDMPKLPRLLYERKDWNKKNSEHIDDGKSEHSKVRYVLPRKQDEAVVWIASNLVLGFGDFETPLKRIKELGDCVARAILFLYAKHDSVSWHGVSPHSAIYRTYITIKEDIFSRWDHQLIRASAADIQISPEFIKNVMPTPSSSFNEKQVNELTAEHVISALVVNGFIYESVWVLDREQIYNGTPNPEISPQAAPLYLLDTRSVHGYKPIYEEGLCGITARIANRMYRGVADENGEFSGTYAAILPPAQRGMITGIYQLRFRARNPGLPGVALAWTNHIESSERYYAMLYSVCEKYVLKIPPRPWEEAKRNESIKFQSASSQSQKFDVHAI